MTSCDLKDKKCIPCEGDVSPLSEAQIQPYLTQLAGWTLINNNVIKKRFEFKGFAKTMAFVNAIAWIAQQQNHHPDIQFGYNYCEISFTTHAINGLSEDDFICASKVEQLLTL